MKYRSKKDVSYTIEIFKEDTKAGVVYYHDSDGKNKSCTRGTLNREFEVALDSDEHTDKESL